MWIVNNCQVRRMGGVLAGTIMAFTSVFAVELDGQTLFAVPDTSPNFASYRYLEECENAALRITDELEKRKAPVWEDTVSAPALKKLMLQRATSRRPDSAIAVASVCLQRFNADTVHIHGIGFAQDILKVLLIAHRDEDARRFAQRVLDSLGTGAQQREWLSRRVWEFGVARPVRFEDVKQYIADQFVALKDDSLTRYRVIAAMHMAKIAAGVGDSVLNTEYGRLAIRTLDSIPAVDRERLLGGGNMESLYALQRHLTRAEGLDSAAISTRAYKLWEANTVAARVFGKDWRKTPEEIDMAAVPNVVGEHYYVASEASTHSPSIGLAKYTSRGRVPDGEIPVRRHVNLIYALPSFCHAESAYRWIETISPRTWTWASRCAPVYSLLRRLKQQLPELEVTILSGTYGTVGKLAPLEPAEEADTLAKLWLGWHHIPARLVVENIPFFHVDEPDGRRIDLPTPYADSLHRVVTFPLVRWTDQDGVEITLLEVSSFSIDAEENIRLLEAMIRRGHK